MNAVHELSSEAFAALAAGGGGADAIEELKAAELSKHLILLQGVVRTAAETGHPGYARAREGFDLLTAAASVNRSAAEQVIRHPPVAVWARRTIIACRDGTAVRGADPARLRAVGAAAAIRAGLAATIDIPATDHRAMLPSLGQARVSGDSALLSSSPDITTIGTVTLPNDPGQDAPGWRGLKRILVAPLSFIIDDRDPFRMPGLTDLASAAPGHTWEDVFHAAWALLQAHHPGAAAEIAAALVAVVPRARPRSRVVSTSSSESFGMVAMSLPPDPVSCAETLVHEVQHLKLGAVQDLVRLVLPDDGSRYYAPWRPDPRPASGLLQGTYAFFGVAAFWRRQRHFSASPISDHAEYARWRDAAILAARTLQDSGRLTRAGTEFVDVMTRVLDDWRSEKVPAIAVERARQAAREHQSRWETKHGPVSRNLNGPG